MADCGCRVEITGVEPDMKASGTITRCALHANAEKLKAALEAVLGLRKVPETVDVVAAARAVLVETNDSVPTKT